MVKVSNKDTRTANSASTVDFELLNIGWGYAEFFADMLIIKGDSFYSKQQTKVISCSVEIMDNETVT